MDDLLREFLTETAEHLDTVDVELVRFERDPNNQPILRNIFRLVHTIKGTCGFLGLPRLEALAHAAETLMGQFRDGMPVTSDAVSLILITLDRVKAILAELERAGAEPAGADDDLIGGLETMASREVAAPSSAACPVPILERSLKPGEVSLDDLERAFRDAPGPDLPACDPAPAAPEPRGAATEATAAKVQTIRVSVETLEHLMTMVSELVLTRNQLLEIARRGDDATYKVPLQRLSHVTAELQEGVMKTRMQPIGNAWQKLPRVIRDLSSELGKRIELVMQGAETELDRQVLEVIKDPLTHMVRNSADHGVEAPDERRAAGKPEGGTIRLNAFHEGGTITIEIADDGRGLDLAVIRRKAAEKGLATEAEIERMSDAQVAKFIFHPGFSTAKAVTSVSGRGVGMDVVKTNIELIGGTVDIQTALGIGTTFTIKIPLTLAIVAALIVAARGHRFAIPQVSVRELVRVGPGLDHAIERIHDTPVLRLRDRLLPIVPIAGVLGLADGRADDAGFVVVSQVGRERFGILVDALFHTEEIVVKPMASKLRHIPLFSGNTILGDGAVILIIDPNGIARLVGQDAARGAAVSQDEPERPSDEAASTTLLVFRSGCDALKAVPLSLVTRLEEIDAATIEWASGRPVIQYRGRLMPLVPAAPEIAFRREGSQPLVVFSDGGRSMGLVVDEIVDIVDERLDIAFATGRADIVGSALVRGRATEIVDIAHFLPLADPDWAGGGAATRASRAETLLLVDDSAFFRDMLTPVLKAAGYRVVTATGAEEALGILAANPAVRFVVTDIDMPGRDGFALVEAMRRAGGRIAGLPVVALATGLATPEQIARAHRLDIADFVAKFDRSGLVAALADAARAALPAAA